MKLRLVAVAVVFVVLASGAWAQGFAGLTARAAGMGGAAIGVADDGAAWFQNPAGLAALNVACPEGAEYASDAMFTYANTDGENAWDLTWSGWKPSEAFGAGAGYFAPTGSSHAFGIGFGAGFTNMPLSAGFNVMNVDLDLPHFLPGPAQYDVDDDFTLLNVGAMYRLGMGEGKAPLRIGVVASDVTGEVTDNVIWSAGLAWMPTSRLLVAVDANDLTDETDEGVLFRGGVEYGCSAGNGRTVYGRVGLADTGEDTEWSAGLGYRKGPWHADFAWINTDPDSTWAAGLGINL